MYKFSDYYKQEIEAIERKRDRLYKQMVTDNPEWSPESSTRLYEAYWAAGGKRYHDELEIRHQQLAAELNREIEVGDGVTVRYFTDRNAYTVIARTKTTLTIQRDKVTRDPSFKPEFVPGGFSAICTNDSEQKWLYERDPQGSTMICHWSEKKGCWQAGERGCLKVSRGRSEYYDYNF